MNRKGLSALPRGAAGERGLGARFQWRLRMGIRAGAVLAAWAIWTGGMPMQSNAFRRDLVPVGMVSMRSMLPDFFCLIVDEGAGDGAGAAPVMGLGFGLGVGLGGINMDVGRWRVFQL